jgi:acetylornithine deacetylase
MGHVLVGLDRLKAQLLASAPHRLLQTGSLHTSLIAGGQELSSYPERCLLQVERRTIPGETSAQVESQIQRVLDDLAAADPTFTARVTTALTRDSFEIAESAPIVRVLTEKVTAIRGKPPLLFGQTFWMDTALIAGAGIPTVVFGTGGAGAHAVVEWVPLRDVVTCAEVLIETAVAWCA